MIRKKRKAEDNHNHDRWMVSYADFVTLLFAFFVVLYATSEQNTEKGKQFEDSVKKYLIKVGFLGPSKESLNQELEQNAPIEAPLKKYKQQTSDSSQQIRIESYIEKKFDQNDIERIIQDISEEEHGTKISIRASEFFNPGSSKVSSRSSTLAKLGRIMQELNYRVHIEGHSFGSENDWKMAADRAAALTLHFEKKYKISRSRLAATSYGASKPILPVTHENFDRNNRIDFLILTDDTTYR